MAVAELDIQQTLTAREESQLEVLWRRFRKHRLALFGVFVIVFFSLSALSAPWVTSFDPTAIDLLDRSVAPGVNGHLLGTDELGRDVFTRLLYAGRISLSVAFITTILSQTIGLVIGAISGYYGGVIDALLMRFVDFMLTIPTLPILLVVSAILGKGGGPWLIIGILTVFGWMGAARLLRGMILSLKEQEFTEASKALGAGDFRIITRHLIPNAIAPIIVSATLYVGEVIIIEAILSFLGFGIQPPTPTWGQMLQNVQHDMFTAPWKAFFPGFMIFMTSLSFNFIGDGLRDALDPRLKL
ncbi:MAG: ABC transporter permease [Ardenticatenaceae bacterium]|nr:ABC transporter permease [Ardenticatenaceae bacterium]